MIRRYQNTKKIKGGRMLATPQAARALTAAVQAGRLRIRTRVLREGERIDIIAGEELGDAKMWWIIAACSGIGWGMQAPAGTSLTIPVKLSDVKAITG